PMARYTIVVLGAGGVGKSALVMRYGKNVFLEQYDPTIEEEYELTVEVDGVRSHLEIIDTAGVEQFTAINESYIQRGLGFIVVFSLTQEASLRDADHIRQRIRELRGGDQDIPMVAVGTKMDLAGEREISGQVMQDLAQQWGMPVYETSAKNGWHVSEVFSTLLSQMRKKYPNGLPKRKHRKRDQCILM
ncbi:ras-domain-containing protein, partial [Epithele typhae]|uniref:ras-domain-containing protein n=1 Tax=Epithele typhae TaxID=378194 RepID=UPI0020083CB9